MQNKQLLRIYFGVVDPYKDDAPIQIFKLITMNQPTQQQLVEQTFQLLLNQGHTTTLDVKNKLRQDYPHQTWNQDFVSTCCLEYYEESDNIGFINNGTYREYYLNTQPATSTNFNKEYSYTSSTGVTIKADTWLKVIETALKLGDKIHWSQSKQQFMGIWEMEDHHILNTIKLYFDETTLTPAQFAQFVQTSPYVKELVSRHPI